MSFPRPKKRSVTLRGHRTSVSLEDPFWEIFCEIARSQGRSINALAAELDAAREPPASLASAIRLFVLEWVLQNPKPSSANLG
ncbi:MAG: ribbon-helix-helix domain-containing protein [Pseudomonadota bacterium]